MGFGFRFFGAEENGFLEDEAAFGTVGDWVGGRLLGILLWGGVLGTGACLTIGAVGVAGDWTGGRGSFLGVDS